ncbi:MAG: GTPase Era [Bacilli bacterium]|nr:GTPase Era [Bacilli bacterium]
MKVGYVSIVGRPNVGKSTLTNALIGLKVAITSDKPQTTRNNIRGIYNDEDSQIVFLDTPGIHKPKSKLGKILNKSSYSSLDEADLVLFMVNAKEKLGSGDEFVLEKIKEANKKVFLIINKVDLIKKEDLIGIINEYNELYKFDEIIPVSALKEKNIEELIKTIKEYLPEGERIYDEDEYVDKSTRFLVGELIREKVLRKTNEEVPHAVTVVVENFEENKTSVHINALVIVERDSLKKILVGHNGSMIKDIGIDARKDIENLVNKRVYLDLLVKTVNNWRDRDKYLTEFGLKEEE